MSSRLFYTIEEDKLLSLDFFCFCVGSVFADAGNAVERARLSLVALGGSDYLTIFRFQTEAEFACLVGINFIFRVLENLKILNGLILNRRKRVDLYTFDARFAGSLGFINLRGSDDLAVACL